MPVAIEGNPQEQGQPGLSDLLIPEQRVVVHRSSTITTREAAPARQKMFARRAFGRGSDARDSAPGRIISSAEVPPQDQIGLSGQEDIEMRKLIAIITLALGLGAGVVTAGPVSASAFGCSTYGPTVIVSGLSLPKGTYCAQISGTGTYVSYVYGQAQVNNALAGTTCNYQMTAEFFDSSGRWYETQASPVRYGCFSAAGASERINFGRYMRPGFMCSTLKSNGVRLTSVCHNIY